MERQRVAMPVVPHRRSQVTTAMAKTVQTALANRPVYQPVMPRSGAISMAPMIRPKRTSWIAAARIRARVFEVVMAASLVEGRDASV